ncbi:MAG: hypothetical protein ACKON9_07225 [Planctomycetaceae bacterium]
MRSEICALSVAFRRHLLLIKGVICCVVATIVRMRMLFEGRLAAVEKWRNNREFSAFGPV